MPRISFEKKEARRDVILRGALDCFAEKGYAHATIDDIAARAGVSKGGVYVHFQSKEEIFCAIARDASAGRHRIRTKQGPGGSASKKLQQYLLKSLGAYLEADNFKRIRFSMEFWLKAGLSSEHARPELKELNEQRFSLAGQDVRSLIEEGIASGEFRSGLSPHSLVYIVLAAIDGMAFFTAVMNQPLTAAIVQDFSELIIRSIKNPEA